MRLSTQYTLQLTILKPIRFNLIKIHEKTITYKLKKNNILRNSICPEMK